MTHQRIRTFIVDSFTNEPFKGNPAGVCLCDRALPAELMQSIAAELNLSETAFLVRGAPDGTYRIRYFSPKMEIPLCGHATLASAKVLFDRMGLSTVEFRTVQQLVLPVVDRAGAIEMQFPIYTLVAASANDALLAALGVKGVLYSGFSEETNIMMLEIAGTAVLRALSPDFAALQRSHDSINGVLVTARADDGFDFHSRYFWPWSGTNEDPVTGGTHTFLAPYWSKKLNKTALRSFQSSARTGHMEVELVANDRLLIRGDAVIVLEGTLQV